MPTGPSLWAQARAAQRRDVAPSAASFRARLDTETVHPFPLPNGRRLPWARTSLHTFTRVRGWEGEAAAGTHEATSATSHTTTDTLSSRMNALLLVAAALLAALIIATAILPNIKQRHPRRHPAAPPRPSSRPPPYLPRPLLTPTERDFYLTLRTALRDDAVVFPQVPLASIIRVRSDADSRQAWHNKLSQKTVDFLACHPATLEPIAAIQLDDPTHAPDRREERDAFVDQALAAAGIRHLHLPAQRAYAVRQLRDLILPRPPQPP